MDKIIFIPRLQRERDKFELLLNQVGFSRQMTMKGVSGSFSVKDLLVDILTHEEFIADRLNELLHDEVYAPSASLIELENFQKEHGYPDYESTLLVKEERDQVTLYKHRNIGLDDIVEREIAAYGNIISALEKLTHEQCLDHDLFQRTAEHSYKPYRRMSIEINHWLRSIRTELK